MKLPSLPLWSRIMHIIQLTTSGEKSRSSQEADRTKCWSSLEKSNRKSQLMMFYSLQQQDSTHAGFRVQEPSRPPVLKLLKSKLQDAQPSLCLRLTVQPQAKVFLEQDLEFLEEPVSQKQYLFSGLEIQDQSQMENDNAASESRGFQLPENKNRSDVSSHRVKLLLDFVFLAHLSFLLSPSAKLFQSSSNNVITLLNENLDSFSNIVPLATSVTAFILMER